MCSLNIEKISVDSMDYFLYSLPHAMHRIFTNSSIHLWLALLQNQKATYNVMHCVIFYCTSTSLTLIGSVFMAP